MTVVRRSALVALTLSLASSLALGACSSEQPQTGSQTNWLKPCASSEDCGELDCVCGTCTLTCDAEDSCEDFHSGECIQVSDDGAVALCNGLTPEAPLCLQRCDDTPCQSGSVCIAGICSPARQASVLVAVDPSATAQELVGFGASISYDGDAIVSHPQKSELYDAMFADSGLDIIRLRSRWTGANPESLAAASEIVAEAEARMENAPLIFLSSSSPAPSIKANGVTFCPQSDPECTLSRNVEGEFDYAAFADHWRALLDAYEALGITPAYLSIQNNPDWLPAFPEGGEACRFLPEEGAETVTLPDGTTVEAEFPGYVEALDAVRTALEPLGKSYLFVAPEAGNLGALEPYTDVLLAGSYDVIGYHLFRNDPPNVPLEQLEELRAFSEAAGTPHMQTEMGADGLGTAILTHHTFVTAGGAAYIQNQFVSQGLDQNGGSPIGSDPETFEIQPVYHALAHFARRTDPGWLLGEATSDSEDILSSAWVSPDGTALTIVLVNQADDYSDIEIATPTDWETALANASLTRTVFNGIERSAALGLMPSDRVLRLPGRSVVTIAADR